MLPVIKKKKVNNNLKKTHTRLIQTCFEIKCENCRVKTEFTLVGKLNKRIGYKNNISNRENNHSKKT